MDFLLYCMELPCFNDEAYDVVRLIIIVYLDALYMAGNMCTFNNAVHSFSKSLLLKSLEEMAKTQIMPQIMPRNLRQIS